MNKHNITVGELKKIIENLPNEMLVLIHDELAEAQGMLQNTSVISATDEKLPYDKGYNVLQSKSIQKGEKILLLSALHFH